MTENTTSPVPGRKRPITVTVSGERGSGKTTLISVVAHALRGSDHIANVPDHVPNVTQAIADLHEQFDVTFIEGDLADLEIEHLLEMITARDATIAKQRVEIEGLNNELDSHKEALAASIANANTAWARVSEVIAERDAALRGVQDLEKDVERKKALLEFGQNQYEKLEAQRREDVEAAQAANVGSMTQAVAAQVIEKAFAMVRDAGAIEARRGAVKAQMDEAREQYRFLGEEAEKRRTVARRSLMKLLTGEEVTVSTGTVMSAEERLLAANTAAMAEG